MRPAVAFDSAGNTTGGGSSPRAAVPPSVSARASQAPGFRKPVMPSPEREECAPMDPL